MRIPNILISFYAAQGLTAALKLRDDKQYTLDNIEASTDLKWYNCYDIFQCALFETPLDYNYPGGPKANVPLVKYSATPNSPLGSYQGMVLINPGGPGGSGIVDLVLPGPQLLHEVIGSNYDIVGFDPRGIGYAQPSANCSSIDIDGGPQSPLSPLSKRTEAATYGPITAPQLSSEFWNQSWAIAQQIGQECGERIGGDDQIGQHMSTAAVATDLKLIVEAFAQTEDGQRANSTKLNYWGLSYGTTLGMTFASMYPDMVGNMVLDANMNPDDYISGLVQDSIYLTDTLYSNALTLCSLAGPTQCPYAPSNTSSIDIHTRFSTLLSHFPAEKASTLRWPNATDILQSLSLLQSTFRDVAPSPAASFPALASLLATWESLLNSDNFSYNAMLAAATSVTPPSPSFPGHMASRTEWGHAVFCSETDSVYGQPLQFFQQYIRDAERQSVLQGGVYVHDWRLQCAHWPIVARWGFKGPFGGRTGNGIQFVANTIDPETPIENARGDVERFEGAKLVTIDGMGHGSLNTKNTCGMKAITNYFQTGQAQDTYCAFESAAWWNITGVKKLELQPQFSLVNVRAGDD